MKIIVILGMGMLFTSCGYGTAGYTCYRSTLSGSNQCIYYPTSTQTSVSVLCSTGTVSAGDACSSTNRVGRCTYTFGSGTATTHYYTTTYSATSAQNACTFQSGEFSAS